MSSKLNTYKEILYKGLRPWLMHGYSEIKFKQLLNKLPNSAFKVHPKYEVSFDKANSNKRKYFLKLIENEATNCINDTHISIGESSGINHGKYLIYPLLNKTLKDLMKATNTLIEERELTELKFKPNNGKIQKGNTADEAFIFQYLKHQLIRLYLEISESYPDFRKSETLELEELYEIYFDEVAPTFQIINKAEPSPVIEDTPLPANPPTDNQFKALKHDIRPEKKGILTYDDIVKHNQYFARFEEILFQQGLINSKYTLNSKHGHKNEMAKMYHFVISKGYFAQRTFEPIKQIKELDIRKFLDHRYDVKLDKQFRTFTSKQKELVDFNNLPWLKNLPTMR